MLKHIPTLIFCSILISCSHLNQNYITLKITPQFEDKNYSDSFEFVKTNIDNWTTRIYSDYEFKTSIKEGYIELIVNSDFPYLPNLITIIQYQGKIQFYQDIDINYTENKTLDKLLNKQLSDSLFNIDGKSPVIGCIKLSDTLDAFKILMEELSKYSNRDSLYLIYGNEITVGLSTFYPIIACRNNSDFSFIDNDNIKDVKISDNKIILEFDSFGAKALSRIFSKKINSRIIISQNGEAFLWPEISSSLGDFSQLTLSFGDIPNFELMSYYGRLRSRKLPYTIKVEVVK